MELQANPQTFWENQWLKTIERSKAEQPARPEARGPCDINRWDNMAKDFAQRTSGEKASVKRDATLKQLVDKGILTQKTRVLDIGAGPGSWALPMAKLCAHVTALEPSGGMIDIMSKRIEQEKVDNISIVQKTWQETDLAEQGWKKAFDLLCAGDEVRMAQILKQRLADVGVEISIKSCNGKTRDSRVRNQNYDLAIIGHGGWGGDPDYLISHCTGDIKQSSSPSASGGSGLASPALMKLLNAQRSQTDPEKRRDLVIKIQQMAAEEVPEIPLFYTTGYTAFRPAKYDGWMFMFDHHSLEHSKLSYLDWKTWR